MVFGRPGVPAGKRIAHFARCPEDLCFRSGTDSFVHGLLRWPVAPRLRESYAGFSPPSTQALDTLGGDFANLDSDIIAKKVCSSPRRFSERAFSISPPSGAFPSWRFLFGCGAGPVLASLRSTRWRAFGLLGLSSVAGVAGNLAEIRGQDGTSSWKVRGRDACRWKREPSNLARRLLRSVRT